MRSTVSPETNKYIKNFINKNTKLKVGKDIFLSYCPERIAENHALEELDLLPQIIGTDDEKSFKSTKKIFEKFKIKIFKTNFLSAELVKLFNNNLRYIEFAMANQFAILANNFNQNIFEIIEMCNFKYPRGKIFKPGLTGGTCLRKDFGMLNEVNPNSDLFLSAWKINEYMPYHLVESTQKKIDLRNKIVGILGYTFKKNSDDLRESLVPKLVRQIEKKVPKKIIISDPCSKKSKFGTYKNSGYENLVKNSDIIFIAINHDIFQKKTLIKLAKRNVLFVDIWNHLQKNTFFYSK
jgi:UDP-N-acetyl-D-mannosaminuronic acid dehydrogenase